MDDWQLIKAYREDGSEPAFTEIVRRYANLVYASARRQTEDPELAKDITQSVFIVLARKARTLRVTGTLSGWLFRTTSLVVHGLRRQESRRRHREIKVAVMSESTSSPESPPAWEQVAPLLDASLAHLGVQDRQAVLLHFFEKKSHKEVGLALGLGEDGARKRVARALEKMRAFFLKRQVPLTGSALAGFLVAEGTQAAPAEFASQAAALALQPHPVLSETVAGMVNDTLHQMFWAPWKTAAGGAGIAASVALAGWLAWPHATPTLQFQGMSDASAAVPLAPGLVVVADDELNSFQVYRTETGGPPVRHFDFTRFLQTPASKGEADWEGATRIHNRTFWITSHGQNQRGKDRPARHRLLAADIQEQNGGWHLIPVGQPYTNLLRDFLRAPQLAPFNFAAASQRPPKSRDALNIEGLCATPEGTLLIGFRNPIPQGKALLVPLLNPQAVVEKRVPAELGSPILLDLGGLGIRDLVRAGKRYFLLAGSFDGQGKCCLYEWPVSGGPPVRCPEITDRGFTPEAMVVFPDPEPPRALIFSDDGTRKVGGRPMKDLPPSRRSFRARWINLPASTTTAGGLAETGNRLAP